MQIDLDLTKEGKEVCGGGVDMAAASAGLAENLTLVKDGRNGLIQTFLRRRSNDRYRPQPAI